MKVIPAPILAILITLTSCALKGQHLPVIKAQIGPPNSYSVQEQLMWEKALENYHKSGSDFNYYQALSEADKMMVDTLELGYGPVSEPTGCSWYCGGGPYKITSSSYLPDAGKIDYLPANVHDLNLFTAWVPEKKNGVIGKKISFHFKPFSPRVDEIKIWNGYIKNIALWKANSRVAKFRMYINTRPVAVLELKDTGNTQYFKIDPVQSTDSTHDLVLTLEIMEVYKGTRYDDVAVSEINFGGLDVHCFAAGTQITMAENLIKSIEEVQADDVVLTVDLFTSELKETKVRSCVQVMHHNLVKLRFEDREIVVTDDHPFLAEGGVWLSVNPDKSNGNYDQDSAVEQLKVGHRIFVPVENRFTELREIIQMRTAQPTYTLELENGRNFIANGLLVKTEQVKVLVE